MNDTATPVAAPIAAALQPPRINAEWPGHGGIYAGIARGLDGQPDSHVILALAEPEGELTWQGAIDWAKTVEVDGLTDFALPTRFQAALLYCNAQERFNYDDWHWTNTESSERNAWIQTFNYGDQLITGKSYEARARAVRLIPISA